MYHRPHLAINWFIPKSETIKYKEVKMFLFQTSSNTLSEVI